MNKKDEYFLGDVIFVPADDYIALKRHSLD